jgi:hypothetical protein
MKFHVLLCLFVSVWATEDKHKLSPKNQWQSDESVLTGKHVFLSIVEFLGKPKEFIFCNKKIQALCKKWKNEIQSRFLLNKFFNSGIDPRELMDWKNALVEYQSVPLIFTFVVPKQHRPKFGNETKVVAVLSKIERGLEEYEVYIWVRLLHGSSVSNEVLCVPSVQFPFGDVPKLCPRSTLKLQENLSNLYLIGRDRTILFPETHELCLKHSAVLFCHYASLPENLNLFQLKVETVSTYELFDCIEKKLTK